LVYMRTVKALNGQLPHTYSLHVLREREGTHTHTHTHARTHTHTKKIERGGSYIGRGLSLSVSVVERG
jgi:hypothetical protein